MCRIRFTFLFILFALLISAFPAFTQNTSEQGYLLINEISPFQDIKYIELYNPSDSTVNPSGWKVSIDGESIIFGADTPGIPPGGFLVLSYGSELPSVPEEITLLQAGISSNADSTGGVVILSDPGGPVDGAAWGFPGQTESAPFNTLPRIIPPYEVLPSIDEMFSPGDVFYRLPNNTTPFNTGENWAYGHQTDSTAGSENNFPPPWLMDPPDGARLASDFSLGVRGYEWADEIQFQVARDDAFTDILIDEISVTGSQFAANLTHGDYFWRVRAVKGGVEHEWSRTQSFTREAFDIENLLNANALNKIGENGELLAAVKSGGPTVEVLRSHIIGLTHQVQHKDTSMVCIDGCPMTGQFPWDTEHPTTGLGYAYNRKYCVRACLSIIASQYGNKLSQDRVSYYMFEEAGNLSQSAVLAGHMGDPYMDLGYKKGVFLLDIQLGLDWVYGQPFGNSTWLEQSITVYENTTPDMDCIADFVSADRGVIRGFNGHATVIDGYCVIGETSGGLVDEKNYIHVVDPWYTLAAGGSSWRVYTGPASADYFFPPDTGNPTRVDEASVTEDSDGDGLVDFDEINRFHTDPNNDDSDLDDVTDKNDIKGYCFNADGTYFRRERDIDGDGDAKELDEDNDSATNMTADDGCEDTNKDGLYQSGTETHPFYSDDDYSVVNPDCVRGTLTYTTHGFRHDSEMDFEYWYVEELVIANADPNSEAYTHPHTFYHSIDSLFHENGCTIVGETSLDGMCRAKLEFDETTGEYFLVTDSNLGTADYTVTTDCLGQHLVQSLPQSDYFIDNDARWPLGVPVDENGGRVCRGRWETPAGLNVHGPTVAEWEIWIDPPVY